MAPRALTLAFLAAALRARAWARVGILVRRRFRLGAPLRRLGELLVDLAADLHDRRRVGLVLDDLVTDADARAQADLQEVAQVLALLLDGEAQVVVRVRRLLHLDDVVDADDHLRRDVLELDGHLDDETARGVDRRQDHRIDADETLGLDAKALEGPLVLVDARLVSGEGLEEELETLHRAADAVQVDRALADGALLLDGP